MFARMLVFEYSEKWVVGMQLSPVTIWEGTKVIYYFPKGVIICRFETTPPPLSPMDIFSRTISLPYISQPSDIAFNCCCDIKNKQKGMLMIDMRKLPISCLWF